MFSKRLKYFTKSHVIGYYGIEIFDNFGKFDYFCSRFLKNIYKETIKIMY